MYNLAATNKLQDGEQETKRYRLWLWSRTSRIRNSPPLGPYSRTKCIYNVGPCTEDVQPGLELKEVQDLTVPEKSSPTSGRAVSSNRLFCTLWVGV